MWPIRLTFICNIVCGSLNCATKSDRPTRWYIYSDLHLIEIRLQGVQLPASTVKVSNRCFSVWDILSNRPVQSSPSTPNLEKEVITWQFLSFPISGSQLVAIFPSAIDRSAAIRPVWLYNLIFTLEFTTWYNLIQIIGYYRVCWGALLIRIYPFKLTILNSMNRKLSLQDCSTCVIIYRGRVKIGI